AAAVLVAERLGIAGPLPRAGQVGVVDEVVDVLVEQEGRHRADPAHVVLDAQVVVHRFQWLEVRVAELRLVAFDDEAGRQLAEGRPHHAVGPGRAQLGVGAELIARMQPRQPVIVAPTAGNRFEDAVAHAGALGAEVGALVAHADDEAPAVQVQRIHHIGGIDVLAHAEVVDARLFLVVELAGVEPADQALDTRCADARAEAAEAIIDAPRLEIGQGQVVEIVVDPDFAVVGLVAAAELAAELELSGVALNVVVAGQVQADILLPVTGVALFPLHFVELEAGRVAESRLHGQRRLARGGTARVAEIAHEVRAGDAARVALARFAVAGLAAQRPQAEHTFATEYVGLDGLGILAWLELAPAFGVAALAGLLGVIEGDAGGVARLGVLEAAVE